MKLKMFTNGVFVCENIYLLYHTDQLDVRRERVIGERPDILPVESQFAGHSRAGSFSMFSLTGFSYCVEQRHVLPARLQRGED